MSRPSIVGLATLALTAFAPSAHAQEAERTPAPMQEAANVPTPAFSLDLAYKGDVVGVAAGAIVLALSLGFVLSWSLIGPIQRIDSRLRAIASGDFTGHVDVPNRDELGTLAAGKNAYSVEQQVSNEVGIRSDLLTGEDLFVIAEQVNEDGTVFFRVFVKPLVNLIWLAGLVFVLGSLITLWPDAREERRLATRYARAGEPADRPAT